MSIGAARLPQADRAVAATARGDGKWGSPRPVWHCLLSAAPTDRALSDAEWGDIAMDVMLRTGLSDGEDDQDVRWIDEGVH